MNSVFDLASASLEINEQLCMQSDKQDQQSTLLEALLLSSPRLLVCHGSSSCSELYGITTAALDEEPPAALLYSSARHDQSVSGSPTQKSAVLPTFA
jgi:hypothetical protein